MTDSILLAVDMGNTNTVFALFDGETMLGQWRISTDTSRTAEEYAVWLNQLMALDGFDARHIGAAIVSSVVPQGVFGLRALCRRYYGCVARVVGEDADIGVEIAIDRPDEVGADRLVNAVGAHSRYSGALIVVDFGTATTFDVISARGVYLGGVIAPGVNLSLESLHRAAAQLPRVAVTRPEKVIGLATIPAMQSGVYWGYIGLVEGIVARVRAEFALPMTVIATGGLATLFEEGTKVIEHVDPDITMRGLREIFRRGQGEAK